MGKQDRQMRRGDGRRPPRQPQSPSTEGGVDWSFLLSAGLIVAALVLLGTITVLRMNAANTPGPLSRLAVSGVPVDGIHCDSMEQVSYHVHVHLTILDAGKSVTVPANTGITANCLYWLHTHDESGVIHEEAPKKIDPTLGNFFDIWGQPLSKERAATAVVRSGRHMRVYLDGRAYLGNPRAIPLHPHADITIEIGPPFSAPRKYNFGDL